ncbi:MAG: hypothetical protein Q9209_003642 [Squamulea sp. 1 TL-2023]
MGPSPLLKQTLKHNHNASNTTTIEAILASMLASMHIPVPSSHPMSLPVNTEGLDPLNSWVSSSPSFPLDSTEYLNFVNDTPEYEPTNPGLPLLSPPMHANGMHYVNAVHPSEPVSDMEYDPSNPSLSLSMTMLLKRKSEVASRSSPLIPSPTFPIASSTPPTSSIVPSPPSFTSPSTSPQIPSSTPSPMLSLRSAKIETTSKQERDRARKGDRSRLDAMKQKRIERGRLMRGRDPVTGLKIEKGKAVTGKGGVVKGKGKGRAVVGGRVGKGGK